MRARDCRLRTYIMLKEKHYFRSVFFFISCTLIATKNYIPIVDDYGQRISIDILLETGMGCWTVVICATFFPHWASLEFGSVEAAP